jgi:hypothetical protein
MSQKMIIGRYTPSQWKAARKEMRGVLVEAVRDNKLLTYQKVRKRITAIPQGDAAFFTGSEAMAKMQGEVSMREDKAGRGMLTAFMVGTGSHMPGDGFFRLANRLGYKRKDRMVLWAHMLVKVRNAWKKP